MYIRVHESVLYDIYYISYSVNLTKFNVRIKHFLTK